MAGRRRAPGALRTLLLLALIALAVYLVLTNYVFVVRSVSVRMEEDGRFTKQDVVLLSGVKLGTRMDRIDGASVAQQLADTGWLELEAIEQNYPSNVTLQVAVRRPAALISHVGTLLVVDDKGVVIEQVNAQPAYANCVYVTDMDVSFQKAGRRLQSATSGQMDALLVILEAMQKVGCQKLVDTLSMKNPQQLILYSVNGVQVKLGDSSRMEDKLRWTQAVVNDLIERQESFGTLNVTSGTHADYYPQQ